MALILASWAIIGLARAKFNHMPTLVAIHRFFLTRIVSNIFRGNHLVTGSNSLEIAAVVLGAHCAPIKSRISLQAAASLVK